MNIKDKVEDLVADLVKSSDSNVYVETINSILYIELLVRLEDEFNIEFPDEYLLYEGTLNTDKIVQIIETLSSTKE